MTSQEPEVTSNQSQEDETAPVVSPKLKLLVIVQGIAILIMIVLILGTIGYRAMKKVTNVPQESAVVAPEQAAVVPAAIISKTGLVKAPSGSVLHKIHAGEVVVTLEFLHDSGQTTLIFLNVATGLEQGRLIVEAR